MAEDYVSVAAFQVMTGVCFPSLSGGFLQAHSIWPPSRSYRIPQQNAAELPPLSLTEDKGVDLGQKANPYFYSCCHH